MEGGTYRISLTAPLQSEQQAHHAGDENSGAEEIELEDLLAEGQVCWI